MAILMDSVEFFLIAHFLAGVVAVLKTVLFIYLAECAPDRFRGWSTTALGSGANVLLLLVSPLCLPGCLGNDRFWWLLPALCLLMAMAYLFVAVHFPESPKQLFIADGNKPAAEQSVKFYHGSSADFGMEENWFCFNLDIQLF